MTFPLFIILLASAQNSTCTPDIKSVVVILDQAQAAFNDGDSDAAVAHMAEARNALALQEATCANYAPDTAGDKRTNPVPFGERKTFDLPNGGKASIQLTNYIDDANEFAFSPPEAGKRLVGIEMTFFCESSPDQKCEVSPFNLTFKAVGSQGIEYSFRTSGLPNSDVFTLYGGGQHAYSIGFEVDEDDTDLVIHVAPANASGGAFFALS